MAVPPNAPKDSYKVEIIELAIVELRRICDYLNQCYDQARFKVITFMGAGLAILAFLYGGGNLFIPEETYGRIFYFAGLGLVIMSLGLLFYALKPVTWYYPTELKDLNKLDFPSKYKYLEYVKDEYIETIRNNSISYESKQKYLSIATYELIIGAIILVVLNRFGG